MDEQDAPIEQGHDDASRDDKLAGLVEQMRMDVAQGNVDDIDDVVRQRLNDSGIELDDAEFASFVASVRA